MKKKTNKYCLCKNKIDYEYFLRFQIMSDIREFEIIWKKDLFFKNKSNILLGKILIKEKYFYS